MENGKACDEAQIEEEDKVHEDSQTEDVIRKPIAEHKGNCPLQTISMKQGLSQTKPKNADEILSSLAQGQRPH